MKIYKRYMRLAVRKARENLKAMEGGPFGACIVRKGRVLAVARNTVLRDDATCHAEMNAIRAASRRIRTYDLSGSAIYSTTEPCPMCFGAIHWSRIDTIVYGTGISDARKVGFNEMRIGNKTLKMAGKCGVKIVPGFMRGECRRILSDWGRLPDKITY